MVMREIKLSFILLAFVVFIFSSCKGGDDEDEVTMKILVDYELHNPTVAFDVNTAKTMLSQAGMDDVAEKLQYDIEIYKITYKTPFEGDSIFASGVVAVPITDENKLEFPVLSYQHGTIIKKTDAPSVNVNNEFMLYLASAGMVVVIPDYIGFGASSADFHPYMHNQYSVNAVLDMIRASKEFVAIEKPCDINDKLFMLGYSQGASATLGALEAIETNNANSDIQVTFASCGSGAYDLAEMRKWIVDQPSYEQPYFIGYLLESYSRYAGVDVPYSSIFNAEYADMIPGMFNGTKDATLINAQFGTNYVGELFNENFVNNETFDTDPVYTSLVTAFNDNRINAWSLSSELSIKLFYGSEDKWIPAEQSLKMWQEFQSTGGGANVSLRRVDGGDHMTTFAPTLTESIDWFLEE